MAPVDQTAFKSVVLDILSMLDILNRPRGSSNAQAWHPCHSIIYPVLMDASLVNCPTEICSSCAFLRESEQYKAEEDEMDDIIVRRSNMAAHVLSDKWIQSPNLKSQEKGKGVPSNAGPIPPPLPSEPSAPGGSQAASASPTVALGLPSTAAAPNPPPASISANPTAQPILAPADSAAPSAAPPQPPVVTPPPYAKADSDIMATPPRLYPFETQDYFHLVASDGGGFYVTRKFLLQHFAFFADFESFPSETEENGGAKDREKVETRELPAASSAGLHLLLSTLEASPISLPSPLTRGVLPLCFTTTWTQPLILARLPDALRIADAYDVSAFAPVITTALPSTPWYRFLVAALASDEAAAKKASTETLPQHISSMPPKVTSLLMVHANSYLVRLRELHMAKKKTYAGLKAGWSHAFPFHDKNAAFGKKCGGSNPRANHRKCVSNQKYDGNFAQIRKASAKVAFEALKTSEKDGVHKSDDAQWKVIAKELSSDIEC